MRKIGSFYMCLLLIRGQAWWSSAAGSDFPSSRGKRERKKERERKRERERESHFALSIYGSTPGNQNRLGSSIVLLLRMLSVGTRKKKHGRTRLTFCRFCAHVFAIVLRLAAFWVLANMGQSTAALLIRKTETCSPFLPSFLPSPFLPASDLVSFLSPLANPTLPKLPFGALRAANGREGGPYSSRLGKGAGWQFNRIFIGLSFGPRIGLSFGSSVKLKRSYVQTARIGPAFTQWGTVFTTRIWVLIQ